MPHCPSCGEAVDGADRFCRHCGSSLSSQGATREERPTGVSLEDQAPSPDGTAEALKVIEENRDLFERIAAADLPISERTAAVLEWADAQREGS